MTPLTFALEGRRVFVAGHNGMVGSAVVRRLAREQCQLLLAGRNEADLRRQDQVEGLMNRLRPDVIVMCAATVGGIVANDTRPSDFLYDNLVIAANVMEAARWTGVSKLLFLGSSCIYPRDALQPIKEDALLTGPLEATNQWYSVAKIAGVKLAQAYRRQHGCDFISLMPSSLYGPNDTYDVNSGHVIPALILKAHMARTAELPELEVWGTGTPRREFLYVDDLADACVFALKHYTAEEPLNVGCGEDISIRELATLVCEVVGYRGDLRFDVSKPDGTPRKVMDVSRLSALGWRARTNLRDGLTRSYQSFLECQQLTLLRQAS